MVQGRGFNIQLNRVLFDDALSTTFDFVCHPPTSEPETQPYGPQVGRKPEAGSRKLEAGSREPEAGSLKSETGSRK